MPNLLKSKKEQLNSTYFRANGKGIVCPVDFDNKAVDTSVDFIEDFKDKRTRRKVTIEKVVKGKTIRLHQIVPYKHDENIEQYFKNIFSLNPENKDEFKIQVFQGAATNKSKYIKPSNLENFFNETAAFSNSSFYTVLSDRKKHVADLKQVGTRNVYAITMDIDTNHNPAIKMKFYKNRAYTLLLANMLSGYLESKNLYHQIVHTGRGLHFVFTLNEALYLHKKDKEAVIGENKVKAFSFYKKLMSDAQKELNNLVYRYIKTVEFEDNVKAFVDIIPNYVDFDKTKGISEIDADDFISWVRSNSVQFDTLNAISGKVRLPGTANTKAGVYSKILLVDDRKIRIDDIWATRPQRPKEDISLMENTKKKKSKRKRRGTNFDGLSYTSAKMKQEIARAMINAGSAVVGHRNNLYYYTVLVHYAYSKDDTASLVNHIKWVDKVISDSYFKDEKHIKDEIDRIYEYLSSIEKEQGCPIRVSKESLRGVAILNKADCPFIFDSTAREKQEKKKLQNFNKTEKEYKQIENYLLECSKENITPSVRDIAKEFNMNERTVRRRLKKLLGTSSLKKIGDWGILFDVLKKGLKLALFNYCLKLKKIRDDFKKVVKETKDTIIHLTQIDTQILQIEKEIDLVSRPSYET